MDEKMRQFKYQKADGTISTRNLYVVHEDSFYYTGFDFSYLNSTEQKVVRSVFDKMPITPLPDTKTGKLDYGKLGINKAIFYKGYRTFIKANIIIL